MGDEMTTWECNTGLGFRVWANYLPNIDEFSLDLSEETGLRDCDRLMVCSNMTPDAALWLRDRLSVLLEQRAAAVDSGVSS